MLLVPVLPTSVPAMAAAPESVIASVPSAPGVGVAVPKISSTVATAELMFAGSGIASYSAYCPLFTMVP